MLYFTFYFYCNFLLYRYLYFTILRDPIQRYLSEWKHVQRGSTWLSAKLMCNGRQATLHEVPFCFQGMDIYDYTLLLNG